LVLRLGGGPKAGAAARSAVVADDNDLPAPVRDDLLLLLTELVTNAVHHAELGPDGSVRVELRRWRQRIRAGGVARGRPGKCVWFEIEL
jgi:anti-sigma regulatory factor (Ser/Thr protein kinase)